MKTVKEIKSIANKYVESISKGEFILKAYRYHEFDEGFLVTYQSKEYIENKSEDDLIIGLTPFIVDKETGEIYHRFEGYSGLRLIELFKKEKGYC